MADGFPRVSMVPDPPPYVPMKVIDPRAWLHKPVPIREWIVDEWIPCPEVTLFYGDGGLGKSLAAQQLMTSTAVGRPWAGFPVKQVRSFGLFCEDDEDELHRRQAAINRHLNIGYDHLGDMRAASGKGQDNVLIRFHRDGTPYTTDRYDDLCKQAKQHAAQLVVIDPAADSFGGQENDRGHVRQFVGYTLGKLALEIQGAVLLCAHPSRAGMASGENDGGSTAWNNSCRSRLTLAMEKTEKDEQPDPDVRILARRKANYARRHDEVTLRWQNGVLVPERGEQSSFDRLNRADEAKRMFLILHARMIDAGMHPSHSKHAATYAPKAMAARTDRAGFNRGDFEQAMNALLTDGKLRVQDRGPPSRPTPRLVVVPDAQNATPEEHTHD